MGTLIEFPGPWGKAFPPASSATPFPDVLYFFFFHQRIHQAIRVLRHIWLAFITAKMTSHLRHRQVTDSTLNTWQQSHMKILTYFFAYCWINHIVFHSYLPNCFLLSVPPSMLRRADVYIIEHISRVWMCDRERGRESIRNTQREREEERERGEHKERWTYH